MMQPQDGTLLTKRMRGKVRAFVKKKGDIYLLADAYDMGRAREALANYRLAIRWLECQLFKSNLTGLYRLCPLQPNRLAPNDRSQRDRSRAYSLLQ